ncbi:unnamed protein product [Phaedon cochleariae]|uniref:BEN domain-containing protein n=1 Tax=Phaedon cochleariae TaxID=80249 RepID=A0A9P0DGV0_PHACE|nr:unnamed protein product [Phaedon cochleariae]
MSSVPVAVTPHKIINRRSLNDSSNLDVSDCLDLSIKEFFVIMFYPDSDPGNEYEIRSEKDLVDTWDVLEKGVTVIVKFGNAKVQGTVLAVSDDIEYLESNFLMITEEHQDMVIRATIREHIKNETISNDKPIICFFDKGTQTERTKVAKTNTSNEDYLELKKKYEELKSDFDKFTSLFSDVKLNLEDTMAKLQGFNIGKNNNGHFSYSPVSSSTHEKVLKPIENISDNVDCFNKMIQIGSSGTKIAKSTYDSINWNSYTAATRKLLITLFPRKVLATHSLTGKPSPAFLTSDKQKKMRLDATIISDIVELISKNCKVSESLVRNVITTKCADENKMYRKRMQKRRQSDAENDIDENEKTNI